MNIFEITVPGTMLDCEDRDWAHRVFLLLHGLESSFIEANLALNLFIEARDSLGSDVPDRESFNRDSQRRAAIQKEIEKERGQGPESHEDTYFEAEVIFKREQWKKGRVPREFAHMRPFLYAKAFLYAVDGFDKLLRVLSQESGTPPELADIHLELKREFPDLRGVRNAAQHSEDRIRGLGAHGKPLELKPVENAMVNAPGGGVLMLDNLIGSRYGSTMADGDYGEVDVSPESMQKLQKLLQRVLACFRWTGPPRHLPSH